MGFRYFTVLFLILIFSFKSFTYCQIPDIKKKVCINKTHAKPREILFELEKNTGFRFAFQSSLVQNNEVITINSCDFSIEEVIQKVFANENLELILTGKQVIVIKPKPIQKSNVSTSRKLINKEIVEIEEVLTKEGESGIDTIHNKYPELVAINRISVSSISNKISADTNIRFTEKNLIRIDYDTNTFIIYDTLRTKHTKLVKLGLSSLPSIFYINNIINENGLDITGKIINNENKTDNLRGRSKLGGNSSIFRKKNEHLKPYTAKYYRYSFLNTNYFLSVEAGLNNPVNYEANNYKSPELFKTSESSVNSGYYYGINLILGEKNWEPEIGFRFQQIKMNLSGYYYNVFADSTDITNREIYYTYEVFPADEFYKYYPGEDTVWITVYDSTRVTHEILTYGKDSLKISGESQLIYNHFEIPVGVGYDFKVTKKFRIKPQINLIYAFEKTNVKQINNQAGWITEITKKEYSSLLTSFDLFLSYSLTKRLTVYSKFYINSSVYSFSKDRNWNYYSSYGFGLGLAYRIRSKKK